MAAGVGKRKAGLGRLHGGAHIKQNLFIPGCPGPYSYRHRQRQDLEADTSLLIGNMMSYTF